ncbi:hypothetical protein ES708_25127 [subsurface metagenome]
MAEEGLVEVTIVAHKNPILPVGIAAPYIFPGFKPGLQHNIGGGKLEAAPEGGKAYPVVVIGIVGEHQVAGAPIAPVKLLTAEL